MRKGQNDWSIRRENIEESKVFVVATGINKLTFIKSITICPLRFGRTLPDIIIKL